MEIKVEQLLAKIGHLVVSQDLIIAENTALKEALKVKDAIKAEIAKLESEGEAVVANALERLKKLL